MKICIEDIVIRKINENEFPVMEDLLYEAIFQDQGAEPLPREIIKDPQISVYIDEFGSKHGDCCYVADYKGWILGAVWARILSDEIKGYGNVDDKTPELAISMFKEYRNKGIGSRLMHKILKHLKKNGYEQISLSVSKTNYAVDMYKKAGFETIRESGNDFLMVLKLDQLESTNFAREVILTDR